MKILINNRQKIVRINPGRIRKIVKIILKKIEENKATVGIVLVNDKTIQELNKRFRKINNPTDVLSFNIRESETPDTCLELLGDVVISVESAIRQAKFYEHSLGVELKILLIHGILHLLDYDHIKKKESLVMKKKEKELFELLKKEEI